MLAGQALCRNERKLDARRVREAQFDNKKSSDVLTPSAFRGQETALVVGIPLEVISQANHGGA
jgi:hypothetical protein